MEKCPINARGGGGGGLGTGPASLNNISAFKMNEKGLKIKRFEINNLLNNAKILPFPVQWSECSSDQSFDFWTKHRHLPNILKP